jgi:hypothetical protein
MYENSIEWNILGQKGKKEEYEEKMKIGAKMSIGLKWFRIQD